MSDFALSPLSYTPSVQAPFSPTDLRRSSTSFSGTIPPDVASERLTRINRELSARFRVQRDPRLVEPPSIKGIGTYTHVNSSKSRQFGPVPQFLPLGGPHRYQREKRKVEPELPKEVSEAFEMLERVLREEDRIDERGGGGDPRARYAGLSVPTGAAVAGGVAQSPAPAPASPSPSSSPAFRTLNPASGSHRHHPPPPRHSTYPGLARPHPPSLPPPPPPPPPVDTQMGGMGVSFEGASAVRTTTTTTATMVDADRDPRLKRRNTSGAGVYGRR